MVEPAREFSTLVSPHFSVIDWQRQPYELLWQRMLAFTDERTEASADEVWLVEHDAVFTLGQAGKAEHLLNPGNIPVVQSDRGGQVTYHGPGQLVVYPLLDLRRLKIGVRDFVTALEQTIIDTLAEYSIAGERKDGAPGVYVNGKKIASLGLRVRRGCTLHGISINVDMDLAAFQCINPCGYPGLEVTQLRQFVTGELSVAQVAQQFLQHFDRAIYGG